MRTTPVTRPRRNVSSARSSSTPSTCSSGSNSECTANRPAGTRVDLMALAILRQLDECELLSLQDVSPSRLALIHSISIDGARAITRRAHLIVPQNAGLQFMCRSAAHIVAACGPSRRARHQTGAEASFTAGDPTPPSTGLVRPWYIRRQRSNSARYAAHAIQARVRWWLEHRRQQHRVHQIHASATCLQARIHSWLARRRLQHCVAAAVRLQAHARAHLSRHLLSPRLLVRSIACSRRLAAMHTARALEQFDTSNLHGATQAAVNEAAARFLDAIAAHSRAPRTSSLAVLASAIALAPASSPAVLASAGGAVIYGGAHVEHGGVHTTRCSSTCATAAAHGSAALASANSASAAAHGSVALASANSAALSSLSGSPAARGSAALTSTGDLPASAGSHAVLSLPAALTSVGSPAALAPANSPAALASAGSSDAAGISPAAIASVSSPAAPAAALAAPAWAASALAVHAASTLASSNSTLLRPTTRLHLPRSTLLRPQRSPQLARQRSPWPAPLQHPLRSP